MQRHVVAGQPLDADVGTLERPGAMTLRAIAALRAKVGADAGMLRAAAEQERPSPRRRVVEDGIVGTQAIRLPRVGVVAITIAK